MSSASRRVFLDLLAGFLLGFPAGFLLGFPAGLVLGFPAGLLLGFPAGLVLGFPAGGLLARTLFPVSALGEFPADLVSCCPRGSTDRDAGEFGYLRVVLLGDPFEGLPCGQRKTRPSGIEQIR